MPTTETKEQFTLALAKKSEQATISRKQVAQVLGIDVRTVTRGIELGEIPSIRIGRRVLIPREAFLAMFDTPSVA
jgi:excisionase family DNA binding protein